MVQSFYKVSKLFLLVSYLLTASSLVGSASPSVASSEGEVYSIGNGDVLDVSVWQSPDLSKLLTVESDGTITYPILGKITVSGLTPKAVETLIREKLSQGYVKEPQVSVGIKEYNSKKILVFGGVEKPGLYKIKGKLPVLELLFLVGGVKEDAKRMTIIRPSKNEGHSAIPFGLQPQSQKNDPSKSKSASAVEVDLISLLSKGDLSQNQLILPGDTIYVSTDTGQKFYVLGEVKKPGPYEWTHDITALEAIKLANGTTERAANNRITIRRGEQGSETVIKLNISQIMSGKRKDDQVIKSGDVIVVPESWV